MSWARLTHPSQAVKPGDRLKVIVLEINKEKERI
jgi:ribosomal protein S1